MGLDMLSGVLVEVDLANVVQFCQHTIDSIFQLYRKPLHKPLHASLAGSQIENFALPLWIVFSADENEQGFDSLFLAATTAG